MLLQAGLLSSQIARSQHQALRPHCLQEASEEGTKALADAQAQLAAERSARDGAEAQLASLQVRQPPQLGMGANRNRFVVNVEAASWLLAGRQPRSLARRTMCSIAGNAASAP